MLLLDTYSGKVPLHRFLAHLHIFTLLQMDCHSTTFPLARSLPLVPWRGNDDDDADGDGKDCEGSSTVSWGGGTRTPTPWHGNHSNGPLAYHKEPVVETMKLKLSDRLHCVQQERRHYYSKSGSFALSYLPRLNDRIFAGHYAAHLPYPGINGTGSGGPSSTSWPVSLDGHADR